MDPQQKQPKTGFKGGERKSKLTKKNGTTKDPKRTKKAPGPAPAQAPTINKEPCIDRPLTLPPFLEERLDGNFKPVDNLVATRLLIVYI